MEKLGFSRDSDIEFKTPPFFFPKSIIDLILFEPS